MIFVNAPEHSYDIIIIGAGPAGLIAGIESFSPGKKILILEHMPRPALKLRMTGKGRCNITNDAPLVEFIKHFDKNGRFLRYAFSEFFNIDLLKYFEQLGVLFKLERGGRYFPHSDKAIEVVQALLSRVSSLKIPIQTNCRISKISQANNGGFTLSLESTVLPDRISTARLLIATGGKSYPNTGSNGSGYKLAEQLGHHIISPSPALVPLETAGDTAGRLEGLSLRNALVTTWYDNKKLSEKFGEMLFTATGLSGPVILALSAEVVKLLGQGRHVTMSIDLKPALDIKLLDQRLLRDINDHGKKNFSSLLKTLLPQKMIPVFLDILAIPADKKLSHVSADERKKLRNLLKNIPFEITGHRSWHEAIITSGGVDVREINPVTMESRLVPGLYFAGEVIDIDADTGGYNLQAAFSTGWVAGRALQKSIHN